MRTKKVKAAGRLGARYGRRVRTKIADIEGVQRKKQDCMFCNICKDVQEGGELEIEPKENDFRFTIESWGQLQPKEIIEESIKMYEEDLDEFSKKLKSIK